MTPEEAADAMAHGEIYYGGIKINDVFYTWEDLDNGLEGR
jgi:hypothetical protein